MARSGTGARTETTTGMDGKPRDKLSQGSNGRDSPPVRPLHTYDDIFGDNTVKGSVTELMIQDLHAFRNHPFRVVDDEDMEELTRSIVEKGVLVPVNVRRSTGGGYEIIAGHRRCHAAERAGLFKVPAVIMEISDEDAVDFMVYSNIYRSRILPSEKAFAYQMQMDALKRKKGGGTVSADAVGRKYGDSARKVQRYIRLTHLPKELLDLVDAGRLTREAGYWISFLEEKQQGWVLKVYRDYKKLPSGQTARKLRDRHEDHLLTRDALETMILSSSSRRKVNLQPKQIDKYFPPEYDAEKIEEIIYLLLERWKKESE